MLKLYGDTLVTQKSVAQTSFKSNSNSSKNDWKLKNQNSGYSLSLDVKENELICEMNAKI